MVAALPPLDDAVVVELGPGTGVFSEAIQCRLGGRGRHIAIESNPVMADYVSKRCPRVELVRGSASGLGNTLTALGISQVDHIVSGLPWQAFAGPDGAELIDTIARTLSPRGAYSQFTYSWTRWSPPGRRQLAYLRTTFDEVVITRTIWRNLPPAVVYLSRRPRGAGHNSEDLSVPKECALNRRE
ncbi:class I SAM-dependent methyltransferase [Nocardia sp. NPDC003963]